MAVRNSPSKKTGFIRLLNGLYYGDFDWSRQPEGSGMILWGGGDVYMGGFSQGKMQGTGMMIMSNGACCCGSFRRGLLDGQAIIVLPNGDKIISWFSGGKRDGVSLHYFEAKKAKHFKMYRGGIVEKMLRVEKGEIKEEGRTRCDPDLFEFFQMDGIDPMQVLRDQGALSLHQSENQWYSEELIQLFRIEIQDVWNLHQ